MSTARQPVHTVYVPANQLRGTTVSAWGAAALTSLDEFGPLPGFADDVEAAVRDKLSRQPIEDLRIDFEDGYGFRDTEDADVDAAAASLLAMADDLPEAWGLRIKSMEPRTRERGLSTLERFVAAAITAGGLPPGFRVTLPKVTSVDEVEDFRAACESIESTHRLDPFTVELQVEMPEAILDAEGRVPLVPMIRALGGRCGGLHYGTYDYSTALGVSPALQSMEHPVADHATSVMQVAAAQAGTVVSHGSTNILPIGTRDDVHAGWALHARLVRRHLDRGIYQGWDLHPHQLPTRYAATYAFYTAGFDAAADRLRRYLDGAASGTADEPATARSLAGFLLNAIRCGAVQEHVISRVGLTVDELEALG